MTPDEVSACDWIAGQHAQMLERTITLANINSGSFNAAGVNAVGERLQGFAAELNPAIERIPVAPFAGFDDSAEPWQRPLGDAWRWVKHPQAPRRLYLGGHLDTVFASDHPFQSVRWLDEQTLNGPGVADLKGGLIVMLTALSALERSPLAGQIGWNVLLNPDEEIGSAGSAPLIADTARDCELGLIFEPSLPNGHWAGQRKGSGNFTLIARGRAAHAGREHHLGRNAIRALCDALAAVDDLNGQRDGVTLNPGFVHGGGAVNVVPDTALARFNIRIAQPSDAAWCEQRLAAIVADINRRDGITLRCEGGFGRPPKLLDAAHLRLYELARECGREVGLELQWEATGGCCDGNNLSAAGVPNIDTLGVQGGKIHSADEYLHAPSLVPRAQLCALLLLRLAARAAASIPRNE